MTHSKPSSRLAWICLLLTAGWSPACAHADEGSHGSLVIPRDRALKAGFLIVDGVYNTELMAPWDVLQHTVYHSAPHPGIEVFTVALDEQPITTAEGLRILPDYSIDSAPPLDILVVPSAEHSRDEDRQNERLITWVRRAGAEAHIVMSLCWGAFLLAEAGLLEGHSCTTFPGDFQTFAEAFPDLDLRVNVSFVHDGKVLTSQGGARSYDVAMYLVDLLFGETVAKGVGRGLLLEWPPVDGFGTMFISDPKVSLQQPLALP
jgi:transcriptional regulator GlxA family with amidase domain